MHWTSIRKELSGIRHYNQLIEQFYYMNDIKTLTALEIMLLYKIISGKMESHWLGIIY